MSSMLSKLAHLVDTRHVWTTWVVRHTTAMCAFVCTHVEFFYAWASHLLLFLMLFAEEDPVGNHSQQNRSLGVASQHKHSRLQAPALHVALTSCFLGCCAFWHLETSKPAESWHGWYLLGTAVVRTIQRQPKLVWDIPCHKALSLPGMKALFVTGCAMSQQSLRDLRLETLHTLFCQLTFCIPPWVSLARAGSLLTAPWMLTPICQPLGCLACAQHGWLAMSYAWHLPPLKPGHEQGLVSSSRTELCHLSPKPGIFILTYPLASELRRAPTALPVPGSLFSGLEALN